MSEPKHCPTCGASLPPEFESTPAEASEPEPEVEPAPVVDLESEASPLDPAEPDLPPVSLLASGSNDDAFLSTPYGQRVRDAESDPVLDSLVESSVSASDEVFVKGTNSTPPQVSSASFPSVIGDEPQVLIASPVSASKVPDEAPEDDEEEAIEERRTPWATVLLASYASALTLALGWSLMKERSREKGEKAIAPTPTINAPGAARQRDLSRKVEPPEPILGEHFATFGKPLKVGSLEVTPIDVKRQDVQLQRANLIASPDRREGGKNALVLRLKLRNSTTYSAFAPLDEAYLRERGKEIVDTYVETADHQRVYPFPLAIESEWSIVGQDFTELRPGESREVAIVTAPDAPPDSDGPFTWRVRLRTGINRTDTIGIHWPDNK